MVKWDNAQEVLSIEKQVFYDQKPINFLSSNCVLQIKFDGNLFLTHIRVMKRLLS